MSRAGGSALAALAERDFRIFFAGQAASLLGDGMVGVALAFAVLNLTGSPADLGYVLTARSVPLVVGLLAGGVIADRLPRGRLMITADLARFAGQATTAVLLISGHARIWELAVLQVVHGGAAAVFNPASTGLVSSIVPRDRLQQANALRGLAISIGGIGGPALAGVLVAAASPGWAIAVDAATFAVSAVTLARLRPPAHRPPPEQSFVRDLRAGWAEFSRRSWVWTTVTSAAIANALVSVFQVLGPAISERSLGGPAAWAAIMTALGVGSLAGGIAVLRVRPRRPLRLAVLALVLSPLPSLGLAAGLPVVTVAALALLCGAGTAVFNALWETALQQHVPAEALSRVSAYDWFGSVACKPVGQAAAGPLAGAFGARPTLWLTGTAELVLALAMLAVPAIRRLPAADAPRAAQPAVARDG